jgi:hypothetical protein
MDVLGLKLLRLVLLCLLMLALPAQAVLAQAMALPAAHSQVMPTATSCHSEMSAKHDCHAANHAADCSVACQALASPAWPTMTSASFTVALRAVLNAPTLWVLAGITLLPLEDPPRQLVA